MLRESGVDFPALRSSADAQSITAPDKYAGKNSVNFEKYEGKTENAGEGT